MSFKQKETSLPSTWQNQLLELKPAGDEKGFRNFTF